MKKILSIRKQRITACILDLDGTLIDSMGIWHEIDKQFFAEHHLTLPESFSEQVGKMTMQEWASCFVRVFHVRMTEAQIIKRIEEMAYLHYRDTIPAKPFAREFLNFLDSHGVIYGVATATYKSAATAVLSRLHLLDRMHCILTAEDVPSCKNTPEMFLQACTLLGSSPEETLVVDDSLHCLNTARQAGCRTAAVYDRHTPAEDWAEAMHTSDIAGQDLQEIMQHLC